MTAPLPPGAPILVQIAGQWFKAKVRATWTDGSGDVVGYHVEVRGTTARVALPRCRPTLAPQRRRGAA